MKRLALCCFLSCSSPSKPTGGVDFSRRPPSELTAGQWVARFRDESITEDELNQRFLEMSPHARAKYQEPDERLEYTRGLVRFELLAAEAARQGLLSDPEVVDGVRRLLVQQLMKKELALAQHIPSEAEVSAYYASHASEFSTPALLHLAHISFRKEERAQAKRALDELRALKGNDAANFARLAREKSQDLATRALEGDMRFLSGAEIEQQYGPELLAATESLTEQGQLFPALVETRDALHIVKLLSRQQAAQTPLEQVKPNIVHALSAAAKDAKLKSLTQRLETQAQVSLNTDVIRAMVIDLQAPPVEATGPRPVYIP